MAAGRPIWKGSISFGLVTIPVGLYVAVRSQSVSFNLLHESCHTKIKEKRFCPYHNAEIGWNEVVRGYQYEKGKWVVFNDEDFDKLPIPSKRAIEIDAFVKEDEVDPILYNQAYFLEPTEGGDKPYALLMKALEKKGLIGIAKIAIREKEQLCALRPKDGFILLETLYFPDEVRIDKERGVTAKVSEPELKLANHLIELLTKPFDPEGYHDQHREAILAMVDAKLRGEEIEEPKAPRPSKVVDLMDALRASVAQSQKGGKTKAAAPTKTAKAPTRITKKRAAAASQKRHTKKAS